MTAKNEWSYSVSRELLTSPFAVTWRARSGPMGEGFLPSGPYTIDALVEYVKHSKEMRDYRDRAGNGWWCPITPQFPTHRNGLGIHPDGGMPGTHGCIGITDFDTSSAKRMLKQAVGDKLIVTP
jgi:hypothetical protein